MQLRVVVEKYLAAGGGYGRPVRLADLAWSAAETERAFGAFDEDYHISRFFHFTNEVGSPYFSVNGFPQTHVSIDAEIQSVL